MKFLDRLIGRKPTRTSDKSMASYKSANTRPPPTPQLSYSSASLNSRKHTSKARTMSNDHIGATAAAVYSAAILDLPKFYSIIARSCMDFEMKQKIDLEIRLRELATQSLLEAQNEIDILEVEKSLLASDQRMNLYIGQLEQRRKQYSQMSLSTDSGRGSKLDNSRQRPRSTSRTRTNQTLNRTAESSPSGSDSPATAAATGAGSHAAGQSPISSLSSGGQTQQSRSSNDPRKLAADGQSFLSPENAANQLQSQQQSSSTCNTLDRHRLRDQRNKLKQKQQLIQRITSASNINCNMVVQNKATLTISDIRIPLMWRDVDHFRQRGDYKRFAIFCLLKIDSQIYDTQLIFNVDRQITDVTFDDVILFNNVDHEFELTIEIYSCIYLEQYSISDTPRRLKEKLSNSLSRAMGKRLATQTASINYTRELQAYNKSYRFSMIASAKLRLSDANNSIKTYDLVLVTPEAHNRQHISRSAQMYTSTGTARPKSMSNMNNYQYLIGEHSPAAMYADDSTASRLMTTNHKDAFRNTLPLFGHFCCMLRVKPDVFNKEIKTGYLHVVNINAPVSIQTAPSVSQSRSSSMDPSTFTPNSSSQRSDSPALSSSTTISSSSPSSSSDSRLSADSGQHHENVSSLLSGTSLALLKRPSNCTDSLRSTSKSANQLISSTSNVYWALLRNFMLYLWPIDERRLKSALAEGRAPYVDISRVQPFCIKIDKTTRLLRVSNSSLTIETDAGRLMLVPSNIQSAQGADSNQAEEISHWLGPIEQYIYDSHIWDRVLAACDTSAASPAMARYNQAMIHQNQIQSDDESPKYNNIGNMKAIVSSPHVMSPTESPRMVMSNLNTVNSNYTPTRLIKQHQKQQQRRRHSYHRDFCEPIDTYKAYL